MKAFILLASSRVHAVKKKIDKADLLLVGLTLYVLVLVVLTIDQLFGPWIMIPPLDRQLLRQMDTLTSSDAKARGKARAEIVSYHEFSIPLLIKRLKRDDPALQKEVNACLVEIAKKFFDSDNRAFGPNPERWTAWWKEVEARLEEAAERAEISMQKGGE